MNDFVTAFERDATLMPVASPSKSARVLSEVIGLARRPQRIFPLIGRVASDAIRSRFVWPHLYSYAKTSLDSAEVLKLVTRWIVYAQRSDGGIAAYYSLLAGYSCSYPEVTGYAVPTLYDCAGHFSNHDLITVAERATNWLVSLQMPTGAFPAGLRGTELRPSVFNTGQILQGLLRAYAERKRPEIRRAAVAAGDWLIQMQQPDGSWSGRFAYRGVSHTYYTMVAWALASLSEGVGESRYGEAAGKNLEWALSYFRPSGWIDGINLQGYPTYLHFIAYVLQGALECAVLRNRNDVIEAVAKSAWALLRRFETNKFLCGAYGDDFKNGRRFVCLTGNAQMSCVWLRLFEITGDLRYLNSALKMIELLKEFIPLSGPPGVAGGVSGSYPILGRYQPLRYISWGCKFVADAILLEARVMRSIDLAHVEALRCAS